MEGIYQYKYTKSPKYHKYSDFNYFTGDIA